jgi:beta-lactamase class A
VDPRLVELLNPPTGVVALAATHVESGRTWRHKDHLRLPSASLIKLPILAAFWEAVEGGRLDPNEWVSVSAEALRVEGTEVLKALSPGLQPPWSDLATLMITVSDNVAINLIIDRLGMETTQGWIAKAGLAETRIERRMMDREAMAAGRGNWTSAADMETILSAIVADTCVSGEASGQMRRALEAADPGSAAAALPRKRSRCQQDGELCGRDPRRRDRDVAGRCVGDHGAHAGR